MSVVASVHSTAPLASLTASNDSSGSGALTILIVFAAMALVTVVSFIGRRGATVIVVDDKPAGSILGFALIAAAIGILYFVYIGPSTGLI